ncbi:MAG: hypothetical protein H6943_07085 [Zoogloeaceae bacterium]|nr:hypothetical protein [Zoogloeaceae bacterium]
MNPTRLSNLLILIAAGWALPLQAYDPLNRTEYLAKIKEAEAVYKEKCEKVAGIRIYKTVPDVEGVLLMKVRPARSDRELADPNWPGAAFGREARGDEYIASFLGSERRVREKDGSLSPTRGHIGTDKRPGDLPGYRWVEVIDPKVGQRYRYAGRWEEPWLKDKSYLKGYIKFYLDKVPSPSPTPPRYAVTFEDHVIPEERALWIASSTVKVLDLQTNDVLGEMTRYAMSYIHAPRQSMPWLNHYICPSQNMTGDLHGTRKFVDLILIPKRGE